jgi:hypothetical protein
MGWTAEATGPGVQAPGCQPEQLRDQRPIPGLSSAGTLADLASQYGELVLEQQNLRSTPGCVPTGDVNCRGDPVGEQEGET